MEWPEGQDVSLPGIEPADHANVLQEAKELVLAARRSGNRRDEIFALTDLGLALLHEGDSARAVRALQSGWQLAQQLGDLPLETDVVINLGRAFLQDNQPGCGMRLLEQALSRVREAADRLQEIRVLSYLGDGHARQGDPAGAMLYYEQAVGLAHVSEDRGCLADLHWHLAIQKAQMGLADEANAWAQAAIQMKEEIGDPQAAWLAHNLKQFQEGSLAKGSQTSAINEPTSTGFVIGGWSPAGSTVRTEEKSVNGPGLLRMAISATKAMASFLASGFKMASADVRRHRLELCAQCEYHTGLRCRICGCFTKTKVMLPHEHCPVGNWSATEPA